MCCNFTDGHVHLHYGLESPDEIIKDGLDRFQKIREVYHIRKIAGIFRPENVGVVRELKDESIYPGVYIINFGDLETLKDLREDFRFVKIHSRMVSPDSPISEDYLKKVIDESISLGFRKFQIHTELIRKSFVDLIGGYVEKHDKLVFYLVHGVNSLYGLSLSSEADSKPGYNLINELRELKNNLLLGCFPSSYPLIYPNTSLQSAVRDGLEDLISFDSDFMLNLVEYNPDFYQSCIENFTGSVGYRHTIAEENSQIFFE